MMSLVAYDSGSGSDDENESDNDNGERESQGPIKSSSAVAVGGSLATSLSSSRLSEANNLSSASAAGAGGAGIRFDSALPKPKYSSKLYATESDPIPPKKMYGDEETMPKPPAAAASSTTATGTPSSSSSSSALLAAFGKLPKGQVGGKVRIAIPSLKDFENDDDDDRDKSTKLLQPSKKGSGLFALLPEPKLSNISYVNKSGTTTSNSSSTSSSSLGSVTETTTITRINSQPGNKPQAIPLVPQQTLKRPLSPNSASKRMAAVRAKYAKQEVDIKIVSRAGKGQPAGTNAEEKAKAKAPKMSSTGHGDSDEEEMESSSTDFFSFSGGTQEDDEEEYMEIERVPSPKFFSSERMDAAASAEDAEADDDHMLPSASFSNNEFISPSGNAQDASDFMKYIQPDVKKAKRSGLNAPSLNIIDLNADDLRPASNEWIKAISDTSMVPPRKATLPGGISKRKHQITYLAAEAKAREEELQNQWAANRHTRRQTQSKYGF